MADQVLLTVTADERAAQTAAQKKQTSVRDLLAKARKQYQTAMAAESKLRTNQLDDLGFVASEQWAPQDISDRQMDGRPCLTINRLPQFINQVTNAARQAKPAVLVTPVGGGSDVETAEVFQGVIRHIEQKSDAQTAYGTAAEAQARIGRGYWRIETEYDDDGGFDQEIRIKRVRNPFTIVGDPATQELDGSDSRFYFVIEDVPKDAYKAKYGDASYASLTEFNIGPERAADWMPEGKVRIAQWWRVEDTPGQLHLVLWPNGNKTVVDEEIMAQWPEPERLSVQILKSRTVQKRTVLCAVINAIEILEGNTDKTDGVKWPGQWIPIVPVIGQEIDVNGEIDYRGMVRDAKDPQRIYNYQNTALVEALALAPKAPYIGFAGQFEGHEEKWRQANKRNFPYLEVNKLGLAGDAESFPQRQSADTQVQAIVASIVQSDNDLKATMGMYDASLGDRGFAQSGKAITALQKQGEMANSNFLDNLARSIRFTGRILVDLIPKIYDTPRVLRIMGSDNKPKSVMIHGGLDKDQLPEVLPEDVKKIYDLSVGTYDVTIDVGPSQESRRQDALAGLTTIVQANPSAWQILGDLIVDNMDWPGAPVAAARLKKLLPQQFQDEQDGGSPDQAAQQLQQAQQENQQGQQQLQQLQDQLTKVQQQLASKQIDQQMQREKIASDEKIARQKLEADWLLAQAKLGAGAQAQQFDAAMAQVDAQIAHAQEQTLMAQEHAHGLDAASHAAAIQPPPAPPAPDTSGSSPSGGPQGPTPGGPPQQ